MGGWIAAGIAVLVIFNFMVFLGVLAASSGLDDFDREADDREQIEAIRKYYEDKEDRRKAKEEHRARHNKSTREKQ